LCTPSWRFVKATNQNIHRAKENGYRVLISKKGFKTITKAFDKKRDAVNFAQQIEGDSKEQLFRLF
jgi:hypothetical protein